MWPFKSKEKPVALATNLPTPVSPPVPPLVVKLGEPKLRIPLIGDVVWWAPKELECTVVSVGTHGFTFVGGEPVKKSKGTIPRWKVYTGFEHKFDEAAGVWIVGQGRTPKNVRGQIVKPDPVKIDLSAYERR